MAKKALFLSAAITVFSFSACSSIFGSTAEPIHKSKQEAAANRQQAEAVPQTQQPNAAQANESTDRARLTSRSSIELLWQDPGESINVYHIRYGYDKSKLDKHLEVAVEKLEKLDDPVQGPLYRFVIPGVEADKRIHFTVQAENQYGKSTETEVYTVAPQ